MVCNILVRNTDDRPRNHRLLTDSAGVPLSPAYDILPASAQPVIGIDFRLAMTIGEHVREATLRKCLEPHQPIWFSTDSGTENGDPGGRRF